MTLLRAALVAGALAAAGLLAAPAAAQTFGGSVQSSIAPPAEHLAVTPGGVDIRSLQYAYNQTDVAIGGDGGLSLARTMLQDVPLHINPFANFSHNWDIMLIETRVDIGKQNYQAGSGQDFRLSVRFGGRSDTFETPYTSSSTGLSQSSQGPHALLSYDSTTGTRQSGTVIYTYTANDGTIVRFHPLGNKECSGAAVAQRCVYVDQITEPDGTILSFAYDSTPANADATRLRRVTSSRGYALLLEYGGTNWHYVTKACVLNLAVATAPSDNVCPTGALATSSYTYADDRLTGATDASNATWSFSYTAHPGNSQLIDMGFIRPGETVPWMTNTIAVGASDEGGVRYIVHSQAFADGGSYGYNPGSLSSQTEGTINAPIGGSYVDALNHTTTIDYDAPRRPISLNPPHYDQFNVPVDNFGDAYYQLTPGPTRITDALGRVTTLDYCDRYMTTALPASDTTWRCVVTLLQSYTDPMGIKTELYYDGIRNVSRTVRYPAPGSTSLDPIETRATYDCTQMVTCAKPSWRRDANGNETVDVWDSVHGGLRRETGPLVNGIHPETRHEYAQRYAWISNGAGGYVHAATTPIWVRTETSTCRTSAPTGNHDAPCATAGDEVRTVYDYGPDSGPNNLLLRGQTVTSTDNSVTTTLRTCYSYDALGRRISETQPNANLGSCP